MLTVMPVYGTPSEAIAMAPVVRALHDSPVLRPCVVRAGQQHPLLDEHAPDAVIVQGGSAAAMAAAVAAFERRIPVVHLEAGRRSGELFDPWPDEANRRIIGQLAGLHLAPTEYARRTLLASAVPQERIVVTGSIVIDALHLMLGRPHAFGDPALAGAVSGRRPLVLVTAHHRENRGAPLRRIGTAIRVLAARYPEHDFVLVAHPDPAVRKHLVPSLGAAPNILVTEHVAHPELAHLLDRATLVLTDSGRVQEEASALATPVLVLDDTTDRPEAVLSGTSRLVGTTVEAVVEEAAVLLTDPVRHAAMARAASPFGDGRAAERAVAAIAALLGRGERLPDFVPASEETLSVAAP